MRPAAPRKLIAGALGVHACGEGDECLRSLAPFLVWDGDDCALEDCGMAADGVLDLDRSDVLAAGDDDVLLAVAQLDVPVQMHRDLTRLCALWEKAMPGSV
jgi:hypothetical protein